MKTWEMIKELTENPEKKFSLKGSEQNIVGFFGSTKKLIWIDTYLENVGFTIYKSTLDEEWKELKEPVTFMEAVKSGRQVKIEHGLINEYAPHLSEEYGFLSNMMYHLGVIFDSDQIREILLEGKFYIKD